MKNLLERQQASPTATAANSASNADGSSTLVLLLFAAALYLLLNLFSSPTTPYLLGGDQTFFWLGGQRMFYGERVYIDFLRFTPPGTDVFFFSLFKLFGPRVWITNLAVFAIGLAFTWQCYAIASKLMSRRLAALASAVFLIFLFGKSFSITHHWFSGLAIAVAINVTLAAVTPARIAAAAVFLALATFFNQAHGAAALLAFALFLFLRTRRGPFTPASPERNLAILFPVYAVTFLLLSMPFILQSGIERLWYFQVTYVMRYSSQLSQGSLLGLPGELSLHTLPRLSQYLAVYLVVPLACLCGLWQCWRERNNRGLPFDRVLLLSLAGTLLCAEVARNVNFVRFYAIAFPGIILFVWILSPFLRLPRYVFALICLAVILVAARQTHANRAGRTITATFPGGRLATSPEVFRKLNAISQRTHPGDHFFQAGWPGLYLPLQLRDPLFLSTVSYLEAARPEDIDDTVRQLETIPVPLVLWTSALDLHCPHDQRCEDYLTPLRDYLARSYTPVQTFADGDTLLQKNP
jgi:hypothetical protein